MSNSFQPTGLLSSPTSGPRPGAAAHPGVNAHATPSVTPPANLAAGAGSNLSPNASASTGLFGSASAVGIVTAPPAFGSVSLAPTHMHTTPQHDAALRALITSDAPPEVPAATIEVIAKGVPTMRPRTAANTASFPSQLQPPLRSTSAVAQQGHQQSAVQAAPMPVPHATRHWQLDENLVFLNHAQYGATPARVMRAQAQLRERMERDPTRFLKVDLEPLMDGVREKLGPFLGCSPADIGLIRNATYALSTILRNTPFKAGDEILITDQEYPSLQNELDRLQATMGVKVIKAVIPFPIRSAQVVLERLMALVSPRTRMVMVSHITSASAMIYPVASIVREMNERGIDTVIDGAHSPGQMHVDLASMRPTYFVGSGHKWLSGPKGIGFFYVRPDKQHLFRPLALSGRAHKVRPNRSLFLRDYDYQGTDDYSALLTLPTAIETMGSLLPGGWNALMRHNHELVLAGREIVCNALGIEPPCPTSMLGSMVTLPLPEADPHLRSRPTCYDDALQDVLVDRHRIVTPIWRLNGSDQRVVRFSAQLYNTLEQYELLGKALKIELAREH